MRNIELVEILNQAGLKEGAGWEPTEAIGPISEALASDRDHFDDNLFDMLEMDDKASEALYGHICDAVRRKSTSKLLKDNDTFSVLLTIGYAWIGQLVVDAWEKNTEAMVTRDIDAYMEEIGEYAQSRTEAMAEDAAEARAEWLREED